MERFAHSLVIMRVVSLFVVCFVHIVCIWNCGHTFGLRHTYTHQQTATRTHIGGSTYSCNTLGYETKLVASQRNRCKFYCVAHTPLWLYPPPSPDQVRRFSHRRCKSSHYVGQLIFALIADCLSACVRVLEVKQHTYANAIAVINVGVCNA